MGQLAGLVMVRGCVGRKGGRPMAGRLAVVGLVVAVIGLAGCTGPGARPSGQLTAVPSVQGTVTASPSASTTQTLAPTASAPNVE